LVLSVLALAALLGCVALVINIGNLVQSAENAQDAADAAATSGAAMLHHVRLPTSIVVPIPWRDDCTAALSRCGQCPPDPAQCASSYSWLDGYYTYVGYEYQWARIVPTSPLPGQILDATAFSQGVASGGWSCGRIGAPDRHHRGSNRCVQLQLAGVGPASSSWALISDRTALAASAWAGAASVEAQGIVSHAYGIDAAWSACEGDLPSGFAYARQQPGMTCAAYELGAGSRGNGAIFWVTVVTHQVPWFTFGSSASQLRREAWASSTSRGLCAWPASSC